MNAFCTLQSERSRFKACIAATYSLIDMSAESDDPPSSLPLALPFHMTRLSSPVIPSSHIHPFPLSSSSIVVTLLLCQGQ
jgi:hypothetical protein